MKTLETKILDSTHLELVEPIMLRPVFAGKRIEYHSAIGGRLSATIHPIRLVHDDIGEFHLDVGFTSSAISRSLLGRDFFNLIQIGFRERHLTFYVDPSP